MIRKVRIAGQCLFAIALSTSTALAQASWSGHWKLDPSRSTLTGTTITFAGDSSGSMTMTEGGHTSTFKTDGQVHPDYYGEDTVWKQVDEHTLQSSYALNGKPLGVNTWTLSPDGSKLTAEWKGTSPGGRSFDDTNEYTRVSGKSGLAGVWKNTTTKVKESRTLDIQQSANTLSWSIPDMKATVELTLDGKDCIPKGPTVPDGWAFSAMSTGPQSFRLTQKLNGKPVWYSDYTLSGDAKSITAVSTSADKKEPTTEFWVKQ